MSKLDLIAEGPLTDDIVIQDQLWTHWFFDELDNADFVVMLGIFGAVFLMLVSVAVLFVVMLRNHRSQKSAAPAVEADGSVHMVPFLCSIIGSLMLLAGIVYLIGVVINYHPYLIRFQPYPLILGYAVVGSILLGVALKCSPRASRFYRTWNWICLVPFLLVCAVGLFLYMFYWFTQFV